MDKLQMCRICLMENIRMHVIANKNLQETYEKLTDIPFVTEDSRPMLACFFCYTKLKQCCQLQRKCVEAEKLFAQMLDGVYSVTPVKIKGELDNFGGYITTSIQHLSILGDQTESDDIKQELPADCDGGDDVELKVELHHDDSEPENLDSYHEVDIPPHQAASDSEDDVPLMKLKTEVEKEQEVPKKKKVNKNKTRKPDCSVILLSKTEQQDNLLARSKSSNYLHSPFKCSSCYKGFVDARAYDNHKMKHDLCSAPGSATVYRLSAYEKSRIILLKEQGTSITDIANEVGITRKTVYHWLKRWTEEGDVASRKSGGRKRKTAAAQDTELVNLVQNNTSLRIQDLSALLQRSGPHVCDICHMRYRSVQLLRTHASNAHSRIFKCNKCGYVSHTGNQARVHEKWHDGHTYECQLCSHTFRKPTSYLSHMRKRHPTEHVCNICGETFVGKHGLQMHKRKTHINGEKMVDPNDPNDPGPERFCAECNIQFYNSEAWKRHILCSVKHTLKTEESKTCSICLWKYVGNVSLETHMKEHAKALRRSRKPPATAKERIFRCNQCGSNFMTRSKLQAHINRTHLGLKYNKNIVCEVCGKKCTSNATLKYHQRTHTGEKPYPCSSCSKHFVDSNQLRIHTRTHTGEKPYVCAACGKRFTQKPALNRHYRVHTGAKPYTCQYCSRTFSQSNSLKLHVKTVHLKQPANSRKNKPKTVTQETKTEKNCEELEIGTSLQDVRVFSK